MGIKLRKSGAVVNGKAPAIIKTAVSQVSEDVGQQIYDAVQGRLQQVLQHPTGHYQSKVRVDVSQGDAVISDGGVIYGPWLEGTSSRNGRSRFKGYATFRKVLQDQQKKAVALAEKSLGKSLRRLQ